MRSGRWPTRLCPSNTISPPRWVMNPMMTLKVVDLPAPFGPITATTSPSFTWSDTSWRIWRDPYPASTWWSSRSARALETAPDILPPAAEVGLENALVTLDLGGRPLGDLHAPVHDEDPLAVVHDHVHVVLDDHDRLALPLQPVDVVEQVLEQRAVHAGRRLVEQDQVGVGHERPGELQELLRPVGKAPAVLGAQMREVDERDELLGPRARDPIGHVEPGHREHILEDRHLPEDARDLERPRDAPAEDLVGLEAGEVLSPVEHLAAVGRREPGDLAPGDGEAASVHGPDPAEGLSEITRLQGDPVRARAHQWIIPLRTQPRSMANPMRPRGMKRATRTMKRPYAIRCAVGKLTQVSSWAV